MGGSPGTAVAAEPPRGASHRLDHVVPQPALVAATRHAPLRHAPLRRAPVRQPRQVRRPVRAVRRVRRRVRGGGRGRGRRRGPPVRAAAAGRAAAGHSRIRVRRRGDGRLARRADREGHERAIGRGDARPRRDLPAAAPGPVVAAAGCAGRRRPGGDAGRPVGGRGRGRLDAAGCLPRPASSAWSARGREGAEGAVLDADPGAPAGGRHHRRPRPPR
jgi:hypothetical protein